MDESAVVDVFCGIGGLTHGFLQAGFTVVAGIDNDATCRYAYEHNNNAAFIHRDIRRVTAADILKLYPQGSRKILIGCAPCQDYSSYNKKQGTTGKKWQILETFGDLIIDTDADIVSMENVPELLTYKDGTIFSGFENLLIENGYHVTAVVVYCPQYGIPQQRRRLVVLASKYGPVSLIPPHLDQGSYPTVRNAIGALPPIAAGETSTTDPLHRASRLSDLNLQRIQHSVPGGTWHDWPTALIAKCHTTVKGASYGSVYGRMQWDMPSPTITTQCHGYGNGRFGHPEQDRAISIREAALLQTFPESYRFAANPADIRFATTGRHIGNAVPVALGNVIARSIRKHIEEVVTNG